MSNLRCWPGALAYIVHPAHAGRLVEVLRAAPASDFKLPDGEVHIACGPGDWVIEFRGAPIKAPTTWGPRTTRYAVVHDRHLRPILPPPGTQITDTDLHLTAPAQAPAAGVHCESQ